MPPTLKQSPSPGRSAARGANCSARKRTSYPFSGFMRRGSRDAWLSK